MTFSAIQKEYSDNQGILRLVPAFVAMNFNQAGGRLHLHPDDCFPLGIRAGSVKERWLSSTLHGPDGQGLSFVALSDNPTDKISFAEVVAELGPELVGKEYYAKYRGWPIHSKFFDYKLPLFHHLHLDETAANRIGAHGKPEAYYFPVQLNNYPGELPITFFGFSPDVTRSEVLARLRDWEKRDVHITELSRAYRLELGSGWYTPPGILHAPGSLLTYEVQWNSAVGAVFENVSSGEIFGMEHLTHSLPAGKKGDWEAILELLDWEKNIDPLYREHYFRPQVPIDTHSDLYSEKWIVYGNPYFGARETVIQPGQTVVIQDPLAYGCIIIQGHGIIGLHPAEAPTLLRYGQLSADEFFISESAARQGVRIVNNSQVEPLVLLRHFGPGYPGMP